MAQGLGHGENGSTSNQIGMEEAIPSRRRIITLKPDEVHWDDWAKRTCVNEAFIAALGGDMAKRRQEEPIKVRLVEGRYHGVAGYQRWLAAVKAQLPALDCEVIEADEREAFMAHLIENAYRRDLHPLDLARKLEYGEKVLGLSLRDLAYATGESYGNVKKIIGLNELDEEVKLVVRHRTVDWNKLYELKRVKDKRKALDLAAWILSDDPSVKEIRAKVAEASGGPSLPYDEAKRMEEERLEDKLRPERCFLCGGLAYPPAKTLAVLHKDCKGHIAILLKEGRLKPPPKAG